MTRALVTFFSATKTTSEAAKKIAAAADADIFEILPEKPYTEADLKWTNPLARCNKEKIGKKHVPVRTRVRNFDQYDTVYIGFPIWYYAAPNIIESFVKEYDWTDKKVVLFATSGGSGIGKTAEKLKPFMRGKGEIIDAKLIDPANTIAQMKEWVTSLEK